MTDLRLVVLTTETLHHAYFVQALSQKWKVARVICETEFVTPPFLAKHTFEDRRETYERDAWFGGRTPQLADFAEVRRCKSANEPSVVADLRALAPDAAIVFGTGRLLRPTIDVCNERIINLHGGDPERYRGLDTHLWAIYHNDFSGLSTTLHTVNEKIDDGRIIANLPLPLARNMGLHELRRVNTEICVRLIHDALTDFAQRGSFVSRRQRSQGRYYSFMPSELKEICVHNFQRFTEAL
jgi:methionyl-tRNA formyltransferase